MDDRNAPATKGDLRETKDELIETIRDSETKLLKALYTFAESNQARLTANERETAALKDRLAIVESRLTEIEKKLNLPPAA
jgi:hypothetical protein